MGRREVVLDAAVEVVNDGGMRGLTHRSVDERAGLASGATSNVFRTRSALVQGILQRVLERELAVWSALDEPADSIEDLSERLAHLVEELATEHRSLTAARHAVVSEAVTDEKLLAVFTTARERAIDWAEGQLTRLGSRDPRSDGRALLALIDGLATAALTPAGRPIDADRAFRALLAGLL